MNHLSWELIQIFSSVAKLGSLSKAAKALNISQPTLSRQIALLEKKLQITLFERSTQGLKLTDLGAKLIESSEMMQQASEQFVRTASGSIMSLAGNVRVSANEVIGLYYLPEAIAEFNQSYPEIQVEIDISNQSTSLHKRDADIALRMFRPTQPELFAKRLPNIELNFVASNDYLSKHGSPKNLQEIEQHTLIGYDKDPQFIKLIKQLGLPVVEKDFYLKTDFLPLQIELARKGAGITITHKHLIQQWDELNELMTEIKLPHLEFWLVCHADVQHNRRIRVLMSFLTTYLEKLLS
ncbi:LysR family transcriptional regulator [Psychromonas algicola]|uniref:LysR family transcriptional regulator n=1 Tax=Psychromonas algicola TaxID=2555642 RepID=UPI00106803D3|nr:LysR family transcriptional regulator [Psychromonas sp. RZ5]TEW51439.1 LysR family transcriptional regulator [Psychromonas sp. RZ5]